MTIRDFTFVPAEEYGPAYTCGPYTIVVGYNTYAVTYKNQTVDYNIRDILTAVEAAACHAHVKRINI